MESKQYRRRIASHILVTLGFTNFYWWLINNYSRITKPLNRLLNGHTPWNWTEQCEGVFQLLKKAFTSAPILQLFDPSLPIILECNASDSAIAAIISQFNIGSKDLQPITFYTCSMIDMELNYNIYDKELLAIMEAFKQSSIPWGCISPYSSLLQPQ